MWHFVYNPVLCYVMTYKWNLVSLCALQVFSGSHGRTFVNTMMSSTWAGTPPCSKIPPAYTGVCVCVYLKCLFIMFCEHQDGNVGVNEILCTWGSGNRSKKHCFYQSKQTVKCLCSGLCAVCSSWDGKQGPVKDVYSLANNPQYKLEVQCPTGGAAVWVLLTRHITDKVELGQNDKVMAWWICVLFTPEQQWCYDVTLWGFNLSDDRFLFVYSGWFCTKQRVHHPRCLQDGWEEGLLPG